VLLDRGYTLGIANRHAARAEALSDELRRIAPKATIHLLPWGGMPPHGVSLVVNATSCGLDGNPFETAFLEQLLDHLADDGAVLDLVYRREGETELARSAHARGLRAAGGDEMLLLQGAAAFRLFTGANAPLEVMRRALGRGKGGAA